VQNAVRQYRTDRDPKEPLFEFGRCLVHFAVDPDEAFMCAQLAGNDSNFLPFNKGFNYGKGNPVNPNGHKTAYLWHDILPRRSLTNIIEQFAKFTVEKDKKTGKDKRKQAKSDLNDMKQEYFVDNRQALSNLRLDRAELTAESTTGAGFAVNPGILEALSYGQQQYALGQAYGSNMLSGAAYVGGANVTAAMGSQSNGTAPRSGGSGRSVTITNNYQEPPSDPHTWSKQLAWEVGVA